MPAKRTKWTAQRKNGVAARFTAICHQPRTARTRMASGPPPGSPRWRVDLCTRTSRDPSLAPTGLAPVEQRLLHKRFLAQRPAPTGLGPVERWLLLKPLVPKPALHRGEPGGGRSRKGACRACAQTHSPPGRARWGRFSVCSIWAGRSAAGLSYNDSGSTPRSAKALSMTEVPSAELLARYRQHDASAAEALFQRYVERLTQLARSRLSRKLAARVDAEDVVLSAFRSFFLLARGAEVTLRQSGDLWRLLVLITLRKVYRNARRHQAECRNVEREQGRAGETDRDLEAAALSREPTPADAAALLDELRCVLAPLTPGQRRIVELRLEGHDVEEIATTVQRCARTVRRTLTKLGEELERRLSETTLLSPAPVRPADAGAPVGNETLLSYSDIVLQHQLGEGGMGKVYRALRRSTNTQVAV